MALWLVSAARFLVKGFFDPAEFSVTGKELECCCFTGTEPQIPVYNVEMIPVRWNTQQVTNDIKRGNRPLLNAQNPRHCI